MTTRLRVLYYVIALVWATRGEEEGQTSLIPCPFNAMCLCRLSRAPGTQVDEQLAASWPRHRGTATGGAGGRWAGSTDRRGARHGGGSLHDEELDDGESNEHHANISEVSCVGVPFASVPAVPRSKIAHVDMVNTGIEFVDIAWPNENNSRAIHDLVGDVKRPAHVDSLRLMGNRILHITESSFRSMADDLKSLDLSFNELDELPVRALKSLRVLDWANFHGNQIASLESLGSLWSHWSPTLRALFLGGNEITVLEKSTSHGSSRDWRYRDPEHHHSLSALRNLYWLNIDANLLTDLPPESLPPRLHTLSAANNRLSHFPIRALEALRDLIGLDLRGNCIQAIPTASVRNEDASPKLRLEKLDLGENLISALADTSIFNGSVHVRDLYLDYNRISRLPDNALRGSYVSRLHLAANGLTTIEERAFNSLASTLVYLDLNRNKLKQVPRALNSLKRLRFLRLAGNEIRKLNRDDLANFGNQLQALSLNENELEQFPWTSLANCSSLIELNLAFNHIENVTSAMFHEWARDLEVLNLKGNQIVHLPARLFRFASKLRELNLSFNKLVYASEETLVDVADSLEKIEINMALDPTRAAYFPAPSLIKPLHHLQWLSLDYNKLSHLPSTVFDHLHRLVYLSLEGNRFNQISSSTGPLILKSGKLRSLKVLRLTHNHLESLSSRTFHNFHELTNIALDHNRIQDIESHTFDHLPKLTHIGLGRNRIEMLEEKAFRWLPNLVELDLHANRLREFFWDAISNCTNPTVPAKLNISDNLIGELGSSEEVHPLYFSVVDASHNLLGSFPGRSFFSALAPKSLHRLILHHNRIDSLDDGALSLSCRHLLALDVSHNRIREVARDAFYGAVKLQMLLLNDNAIDQLPGGTFANLRSLRIVDLSGNKLRSLPSDLFANTVVESLSLARNQLVSMPSGCLASISATLANLDLSRNEIEHLDAVVLSTVPHLVSLNLAHNRLTLLPDNLFSHLNSLLSLDLSFNAIRANFKELFHELQHVKRLNLAGIGLSKWPSMPLPRVVFLNLSSNGLEYRNIEQTPNVGLRLDSLRTLDLSHNRLAIVPSFLWSAAPLLREVNLSFNAIRTIHRDSFTGLNRLQTLIMRPLPVLETIESDSFQHLLFLNKLVMQTWAGLHLAHLLPGLRGLKTLSVDIRGSVLSSVHFDSIGNLDIAPKLREVEITGNQLRIVHGDIFSNINIHSAPDCTVSLKHTSIKYLPNGFVNGFAGCASMTIDLTHNTLHTIGHQALRDNTTASSMLPTHFLGGLRLDGNPVACSCEITWLGYWFKRWHVEKESLIDPIMRLSSTSTSTSPVYEAICRDPISNRKHLLIDLTNSESMCGHSSLGSGSSSFLSNKSAYHLGRSLPVLYVIFTLLIAF